MLEELLLEFGGTVLLVSHDREFLNNVVTSTLVFEGDGKVAEFVGGYDDWIRQREIDPFSDTPLKNDAVISGKEATQKKPNKLSYKDQRELDELPEKIESLETRVQQLTEEMGKAEFFQQDKDSIVKTQKALEAANTDLEACYKRWEELESVEL